MHTTLKNYKTALEYNNLYTSLNDSIFNEEKFKTITDIQTKYETEKKEKEIDILTKNTQIQMLQLRNSRIIILSIILGFITVLMLASMIYKAYRKTKIEVEKRKAAEKELSELNRNLEQRVENEVKIRRGQEQKAIEQSRLASLGELAAGIAHEINQPLHSIAFSVDNMKMAIEEGDADSEYLQKKTKNIFSDVDRMKRIVDHIRTFSRKQTGEKKAPFSINQSIANAIDMIGEQYANHRIKLKTDLDENLPEILGNLYRFEQVVLILLSNGKDAVEEKALTADEGFRKELRLKTYKDKSKIVLEFTDTGSGIPSENLEKIFNPFYTTKKSGEGTGLGLSIAFGIIGEMDGTISVESDVGIGTKMIIQFPANILEV
jgi:signal transduction histidine kinase